LLALASLAPAQAKVSATPPKAGAGFVSHRAFGGYSGMVSLSAQILTPIHVSESGEPSDRVQLADGPVNG
jgi:hypothetical protein